MTYFCFIYSRVLFYFDVPHAVDVSILWTRFFIFAFRSRVLRHRRGFGFRRGFYRQRFRRGRRGRFRLRFGRVFQHRFRFVILRQSVQFSSFGDDLSSPSHGLGRGRRVVRGFALCDHGTFNLRGHFIHNQLYKGAFPGSRTPSILRWCLIKVEFKQ